MNETKEKIVKPMSGYLLLLISLGLLGFGAYSFFDEQLMFGGVVAVLVAFITFKGLMIINPNEASVMTLFGKYVGTVKENGFFWVNPLYSRGLISLKARNFDSDRVKVNDKLGNPILISVILVWKVEETFRAAFDVDNYNQFVEVQCDAAVRKLAGLYPYDNLSVTDHSEKNKEITLRSGLHEVNHALENELRERLQIAGINVIEARIGYLAYASEIAGAMLKRQQATAVVAARTKIVEGAVGMVQMALKELSEKNIIELSEEQKAKMVSNLMVVLCSDKETTPVLDTTSVNH